MQEHTTACLTGLSQHPTGFALPLAAPLFALMTRILPSLVA